MLLIGLLFGGLAGFLIAAGYGVTLDGHDHDHDHGAVATDDHSAHDHGEVISLDAATAPTIDLTLHTDPMGGWNIQAITSNFRFAPEHVSTAHVAGEGHAHYYVNGEKIGRMYSAWQQLPAVESGDVVTVNLSSNDHKTLAIGPKAVTASVTIP